MSVERQSRSESRRELFGSTYIEIEEYKPTGTLAPGSVVIGRMLHLCKRRKGNVTMTKDEASKIVAKELRCDWIYIKNVYPMKKKYVAAKVKEDYEKFSELRKAERCANKRKSDTWFQKASEFNDRLTKHGYNIRCNRKEYQEKLENKHKVKMTAEDQLYYEDNCLGAYRAVCTNTVPKDWLKSKKRTQSRESSLEKKRRATEKERREQRELNDLVMKDAIDCVVDDDNDVTFVDSEPSTSRKALFSDRDLRSSTKSPTVKQSDNPQIPWVKVRTGRRSFNESVIRCLVQCLCESTGSPNEISRIVVNVANMIFGQKWRYGGEDDLDEEGYDDECESSCDEDDDAGDKSSRRHHNDLISNKLTYVLPRRRTIMRYLQDASYLNLEHVAQQLLNKGDSVVTTGLDDTTKAAGHRHYDVKTDHITVVGKSGVRTSLTTGYVENLSHSGEDGAKAYDFKLKTLAVLANCTLDDIKSQIDFWMSDRASDCNVLLDNLGIDPNKRLKCCAHIVLCVDYAIDKVYKNAEQKIGIQNLLPVTVGEKVFRSPGSSVHTLGLIALAKLFSPSHAAHTVSLYKDYTLWMEDNEVHHQGFRGFVSNRFGRIADLASLYLQHRAHISAFMDSVVDINSNKLVLAVATYVESEWFTRCSEIYTTIGNLIIFPLMRFLGIDQTEQSGERNDERNWAGVKVFFDHKLTVLKELIDAKRQGEPSGLEKLEAAVMDEIVDSVERQLSEVQFLWQDEITDVDQDALEHAPLTNLGCESQFAKLDNRIRVTGGSTSVTTHSQKNIVVTNGLLVDSSFEVKSAQEKKRQWKWARCSEEVQRVKKMEADFLATVKATKKLSLLKKEQLKMKKTLKTREQTDICKLHGGPVTSTSIHLLEQLTEKQLLSEVSYLRLTVAPEIRQKRRVKTADGRYRFEKFGIQELRDSIKNVLKPESHVSVTVESLLSEALE